MLGWWVMTRMCPSLERKKQLNGQLTMLITIDAKKALQKPGITNPGTREEVSKSRRALMTRINTPSVRIINGRLRSRRTGRTKALTMPNRREAPTSTPKLEYEMPGIT